VQLVMTSPQPPPAGRAPPRSSSSSPSPPRERRHAAAPRTNPRAAPLPADENIYGRTRRLKAGRRTSTDVLPARRQQHRSDSESSAEESRPGRESRLKSKARRCRTLPDKSFEDYEDEIRQLHQQMEQLHSRLSEEPRAPSPPPVSHICQPSPGQIGEILNRLSLVEHELRREQGQLSSVLTQKERVIEEQNSRIQELHEANSQLHNILASLRAHHPQPSAVHPAAAGAAGPLPISDTSDYKSSSC